jgi:PAS domain S-box-containing protein
MLTKKVEINMHAPRIFTELQSAAQAISIPLYWLDLNQVILGINDFVVTGIGANSITDVVGKTPYELYPYDLAHEIVLHHQDVISSGETLVVEEVIKNVTSGATQYYTATIWPLRDDNGNIIGTAGTSADITNKKIADERLKNESVLKHFALVTEILPIPIYWLDKDQKYLGVNNLLLKAIGANFSQDNLIGKTPLDIYPEEMARNIMFHHNEVVRTGQLFSGEESIEDITTKEIIYFNAIVGPLRGDDGNIIGTMGTSIDITAKKEADSLKLENESYKAIAQEQEKFKKITDQVAHDIRSPLASLLMIVKACQSIPERERVALREAATTIGDIANNLLSHYRKKEADHDQELQIEDRESVLVSPIALQILTDKKYQYQNLSIKLDHNFSQTGNFAWIKIEPTAFKRMLSNIINNSVDAFDQKEGKIILYLDADEEYVRITIEDNGKGIKPELVQKILDNTAVTEGKVHGHGIGLTQVRETLQNNEGQWVIDSQVGLGTKFILTFPRAQALNWIAETIQLNDDDTVVILDDDSSIHMAWDIRFDVILKKFPHLTIKHFEQGQEAIDFINGHTPDKKQKIFLLADYELLKQNLDGLEVINKTQISRSILVTSHYAHKRVQQLATKTATKILPKQLASDIAIKISKTEENETTPMLGNEIKEVDVVFVDDDQRLLDSFTFFAFNKEVDTYQNPQHFLDNIHQYPKHTKIMLDHHYTNFDQKGLQIAEHLHGLGFTQLYLLSGESFSGLKIPDYLTAIMKTDLDKVEAVLNGGLK